MNLLEILKKNADNAKSYIDGLVSKKQDILTFDTAPTEGSQNPVTSDGIQKAIAAKTVDLSNYPTKDGTGATGNWSINAATATTATNDQYSNNIADSTHVLKPNTAYNDGDISTHPSLPAYTILKCMVSGTTDDLSTLLPEDLSSDSSKTADNTWTVNNIDYSKDKTLDLTINSEKYSLQGYNTRYPLIYIPDKDYLSFINDNHVICICVKTNDTIKGSMFEEKGVIYEYMQKTKLRVKDSAGNIIAVSDPGKSEYYNISAGWDLCGYVSFNFSSEEIGKILHKIDDDNDTLTLDFISAYTKIGTAYFIVTNELPNSISGNAATATSDGYGRNIADTFDYMYNSIDNIMSGCTDEAIASIWGVTV